MSRDESSFMAGFGGCMGVLAAVAVIALLGGGACVGLFAFVNYSADRADQITREATAREAAAKAEAEAAKAKEAAALAAKANEPPPPPKPPPTPADEASALSLLREAKGLIAADSKKSAAADLERIVAEYPDTKAAPEARELLKTLGAG